MLIVCNAALAKYSPPFWCDLRIKGNIRRPQ